MTSTDHYDDASGGLRGWDSIEFGSGNAERPLAFFVLRLVPCF